MRKVDSQRGEKKIIKRRKGKEMIKATAGEGERDREAVWRERDGEREREKVSDRQGRERESE